MNERIFIRFPRRSLSPADFGGTDRVNESIAQILERHFELSGRADEAALQICSLEWDAPASPRRLFIDHGAFADASFWAFTAPKLRSTDAILVSSNVCARVAERMLVPPRPMLNLVPFFADTDLFHPSEDRPALRRLLAREHAIPEDGPLLLAASGYARRKNLHLAVRFFAELSAAVPTARLAIVGDPGGVASREAYASTVRSLAAELELGSRIHQIRRVPHLALRDLMAASDLLVHLTTCRLENFGLIVAEALASGLPVVAADWGGIRDLVQPGETGILASTHLTSRGPRVDWLGPVEEAVRLVSNGECWRTYSVSAARFARAELGLGPFEDRLVRSVREILRQVAGPSQPVMLSEGGKSVVFETFMIRRVHPQLSGASEEYRLLLESDGGISCRFLTGPAATSETPPFVGPDDRPYAAVDYSLEGSHLVGTDPVWPTSMELAPGVDALLATCDGSRSLAQIAASLPVPLREMEAAAAAAKYLVDHGMLCLRKSIRPGEAGRPSETRRGPGLGNGG